MNPFDTFLVIPLINLIVSIYHVLFILHIPFALGFAIILLTIVVRLLLYPLTTTQLKASKKMQELSPHLSHVKEKHKGDASRIQQETMRLYKEHGVNPVAGCLPVLVQIPVIWALYTVLQKVVTLPTDKVVSEINKLVYPGLGTQLTSIWDQHFFGIPLGQSPAQIFSSAVVVALATPLLTAFFQFLQSKMMFAKPAPSDKKLAVNERKGDDFASIMQTQSTYIFPIMIGVFSYTLPIGLSLYWNTFTIFGILQQYKVQGWGGLENWINKINKRNG